MANDLVEYVEKLSAKRLADLGDGSKPIAYTFAGVAGKTPSRLIVERLDGSKLMEFSGHWYARYYEDYYPACRVTAYDQDGRPHTLFDTDSICTRPYHNEEQIIGSEATVARFIRENGDCPIRLRIG